MTPIEYYQAAVARGEIKEDVKQLYVMQYLETIYSHLIAERNDRKKWTAFLRRNKVVKGLYVWGSVGIGKTFMMDCFYQALPFPEKMRMHFHRFMAMVHQSLKKHQGEKNPLRAIAAEIAKRACVICFDEFYVADITDAMLLGGLFSALFAEGVTLVATSNMPPNALYKNGLQREQFLPAIELIQRHTDIIYLDSKIDYRLQHLSEAGVFFTPLDELADKNMVKSFSELTAGQFVTREPVTIQNRLISILGRSTDVIWFEFSELCHVPRSQQDYLEIVQRYKTVLVSHVPVISETEKDTICLFVSLIDVFYDARVRLVMSAAESIAALYSRGFMLAEYTRTHSRLLEMQSTDYFLSES